jgi:hypothetical protein
MLPCSVMITVLIFGFGFVSDVGLPDGRFNSRLLVNCGVVIMKITSSTKTRSSNGVMFSSLSEL